MTQAILGLGGAYAAAMQLISFSSKELQRLSPVSLLASPLQNTISVYSSTSESPRFPTGFLITRQHVMAQSREASPNPAELAYRTWGRADRLEI